MAVGKRRDPLPGYAFRVVLQGVDGPYNDATAIFKSVSGLKYETEAVDYREGGDNLGTRRLPGAAKWSNIVLKQGFAPGFGLISWVDAWMQSEGKTRIRGEIHQLNSALETMCRWGFEEGWPCKWELSEFDASKSELSIETLEIAHEGLRFAIGPGPIQAPAHGVPAWCSVVNTEDPSGGVKALYNPKEVTIEKSVPWNKHKNAKGNAPMLEYTNGENRVLSVELMFDTCETGSLGQEPENVYDQYVSKLEKMTLAPEGASMLSKDSHPPLVIVCWSKQGLPKFPGVITSLVTKYTRFSHQGTPIRATCSIKVKEMEAGQVDAFGVALSAVKGILG